MALNPFFLQGSANEQNLVQSLVNEQLKIYGVEVTYIPRKFVNRSTVFQEIEASKFDDNFQLEAYVNTWDGYSGAGDVLTKFGMSLRDELQLVISRERFEDFISPFLSQEDVSEVGEAVMRPREGDLVFFPLGGRLFEIKFVEHEVPFYQLGHTYVYELQCELFEYNDETIDTGIDAIDSKIEDLGVITDLQMNSVGSAATAIATIGTGFVKNIVLSNDGSGFTSIPTIGLTTAPSGGTDATAVGILTTRNNVTSIEEIVITNSGAGYTVAPVVTISGGGGVGAAATALIRSDGKKGIIRISIGGTGGVGYSTVPNVSISLPSLSPQLPASARAEVGAGGTISSIFIQDAGAGFFSPPTITVGPPSSVGIGSGSYWFNELVTGSRSNATARVKNWDLDTKILQVGIETGTFFRGETITGSKSGATYTVQVSAANTDKDKYDHSDEIENEADQILDFSEGNPFGLY